MEKTTKFVERMKRIQEKAGAVVKKAQEEIKRQTNSGRRETKVWKKGEKGNVEHQRLSV